MEYTTYFHIAKPPYQTARYDQSYNADMDLIEIALLGFPGTTAPGTTGNYPDVVPHEGMRWLDTANDQEKVFYNSTWQVVKTFT